MPFCAFVLAVLLALALYWVKFDGNVTGFFRFGDRYPPSPLIEQDVRMSRDGQGYDGQFFLAIALDPLLQHPGSTEALDFPRYRYRRILYPLAGHVLGLGHPKAIPYTLVLINVLCIPILVLLGARLLGEVSGSKNTLLSILVLAPVGVWVSFCLSTCDLMGTTLFLAALYAAARGRPGLSALFVGCAGLTRETYLAIAVMLSMAPLLNRGNRRIEWRYLLSIIPGAWWLVHTMFRFPAGPDRVGEHFGAPLGGILGKLGGPLVEVGVARTFDLFCFVLLLVAAVLATSLGAVCCLKSFGAMSRTGDNGTLTRSAPGEKEDGSGLREQAGDEIGAFAGQVRSAPGGVVLLCGVPYVAILLLGTTRMFGYYAHHARIFMDLFLLMFLAGEATRVRGVTRGVTVLSGLGSVAFVLHYTLG